MRLLTYQVTTTKRNYVNTDRNGDIGSVILCVANSNNSYQKLRQLIPKIVALVKNEIDSPRKEAIRLSQDETHIN